VPFHYNHILTPNILYKITTIYFEVQAFESTFFSYLHIYGKTPMETSDLRNQLKLKQTELNLTTDPDKKRKLATDIQIINHKLSIERIKQLIQNLQNR